MINFEATHLCVSSLLLGTILFALYLRGKSHLYIFICGLFGLYLIGAISVAVFPFYIDFQDPGSRLDLNLMPFNFGGCFDYMPQNCMKNIFNNILLTIPFGFLFPLVFRVKGRNMFWILMAIGASFELTQLFMALFLRTSFRSIDINDVILNTIGAFLGYAALKIALYLYRKFFPNASQLTTFNP